MKKILRQRLGQFGLAGAARADEQKHAHRSPGILQSRPPARANRTASATAEIASGCPITRAPSSAVSAPPESHAAPPPRPQSLLPGGSSNGYFWVYRGLTGDFIFDWQTNREHPHASEWLGPDHEGILQSDGYQTYENSCLAQRAANWAATHCAAHPAIKSVRPEAA